MDALTLVKASNQYLLRVEAQSIGDEIRGMIANFVHQNYDPKNKVASIAAFLTPGILWKLGFKKITILVAIAEALGFDLKGFWQEIVSYITSFFTQHGEGAHLPSLNDVVSESFDKHFSGEPDPKQMQYIQDQGLLSNNDREYLLVKNGRVSSSIFSKLKGKLVPLISWVMMTALTAAGFNIAVSAAKHFLGTDKPKSDTASEQATQTPGQNAPEQEAGEYKQYKNLQYVQNKLNPNLTPELTEFHKNDMNAVWLLEVDIQNLSNELMRWILEAYSGSVSQIQSELQSSNAFQKIVALFWRRNKLAQGLGLIAVPKPFERKIDIVNAIIMDFIEEHRSGA